VLFCSHVMMITPSLDLGKPGPANMPAVKAQVTAARSGSAGQVGAKWQGPAGQPARSPATAAASCG
jgi:hypothetical protein